MEMKSGFSADHQAAFWNSYNHATVPLELSHWTILSCNIYVNNLDYLITILISVQLLMSNTNISSTMIIK